MPLPKHVIECKQTVKFDFDALLRLLQFSLNNHYEAVAATLDLRLWCKICVIVCSPAAVSKVDEDEEWAKEEEDGVDECDASGRGPTQRRGGGVMSAAQV